MPPRGRKRRSVGVAAPSGQGRGKHGGGLEQVVAAISGSSSASTSGSNTSSASSLLETVRGGRRRSKRSSQRLQEKEEERGGVNPVVENLIANGYRDETLVPIWLDMKIGGNCIEERFLWSTAETEITPFQFARSYCIDMDFPDHMVEPIRKEMERQIQSANRGLLSAPPPIPSSWNVSVSNEALRIIRLNIVHNEKRLIDQFEWDVYDSSNSPEAFARTLANDMGLPRVWENLIAHGIRDQLIRYRQEMAKGEQEVRVRQMVMRETAIRELDELCAWTPVMIPKASPHPFDDGSSRSSYLMKHGEVPSLPRRYAVPPLPCSTSVRKTHHIAPLPTDSHAPSTIQPSAYDQDVDVYRAEKRSRFQL
mmetsp:Transcript_4633/g.11465  ORF Transcript_4633/g.11465 Transcript_4633/m.11465 type:complete len:366 (+) Transcript_4633:16-1113(+)